MESKLAQTKIKAALKEYLRRQDYTYADVAKVWGCSVPTVKRQLGQEEIPLGRLLELLDWLNISLADIEKMAKADIFDSPRWTQKQNEFLAKNPRELAFLMKVYAEQTPVQIAKKYQLDQPTVGKILIQLEKFDLIRIGAGGKVKPFYESLPRFEGPIARATFNRQVDQIALFQKHRMAQLIAHRERGGEASKGGMSWNVVAVAEETYNSYVVKFNHLMEELTTAAKLDERTKKKTDLKKALINYGLILNEPDEPSLEWIESVFDSALKIKSEKPGTLLVGANN